MNNLLKQRTNLFVQNRDIIKSNFRWDNSMLFPLCASLYTERDLLVDVHKVKVAKNIVKNNTGLFSNFRGTVSLVYSTMLSLEEDPDKIMKNALKAYTSLKREFWSSQYLPLSAFVMAKMVETFDYDKISKKAKLIYQMMKNKHPFLTSSEDSGFAVIYAMSDLDVDKAVEEMERCFHLLKSNFFSKNAVQSVSHALALGEEESEAKCNRVISIYKGLREKGYKYGPSEELAVLGVLALETDDVNQVINDIIKVNNFLLDNKGFGFWGVGTYQRMMYGAILVMQEYKKYRTNNLMNLTSINSVTSIIIAQQIAISAAITASVAASTSNNN